jgi:hypothetical protein
VLYSVANIRLPFNRVRLTHHRKATMAAKLAKYGAEAVDYRIDNADDPAAKAKAAASGYWGPWL